MTDVGYYWIAKIYIILNTHWVYVWYFEVGSLHWNWNRNWI